MYFIGFCIDPVIKEQKPSLLKEAEMSVTTAGEDSTTADTEIKTTTEVTGSGSTTTTIPGKFYSNVSRLPLVCTQQLVLLKHWQGKYCTN